MRRSGSSSCMLRPRSSTESSDTGGFGEQLSVTMISRDELPSYSTERFFMLSEFHLNAHSMRFVSDLTDSDDVTPETVETNLSSSSMTMMEEFQNDSCCFPSFLIFYILWRPEMTTDASAFIENVILPAIRPIQAQVDICLSDEDKKRTRTDYLPNSPSSGRLHLLENDSPDTTREHDSVAGSSNCSFETNGKTRLYLVVERTVPTRDDAVETNQESKFEEQVKLAEKLAKHAASHSQLRSLLQGITIGVSNHQRAAPGLDACLDVINYGASDRRKIGRDVRSSIGLIAIGPEDMLGLDEEQETDAVQDVLQTRISTEWNGKGNLKSFGRRAHELWRRDSGLPPQSPDFPLKEGSKRKFSRRRLGRLDEEFESVPFDLILNVGAFLLVAYYVWMGLMNHNSASQ